MSKSVGLLGIYSAWITMSSSVILFNKLILDDLNFRKIEPQTLQEAIG
jgi:hypothetical protein